MRVPVMMVVATTCQEPRGRDIDHQTQRCNRNRFAELDRYGLNEPDHGLVADQNGDQGEDDGGGESGEIAQLAGPETEARIMSVASRVAVGECGQQERACVRRHVQAISDERQRSDGIE